MVRRFTALCCGIALAAGVDRAAAEPEGSTVTGTIQLAELSARPELPVRSRGFTRRIRGPLKPPRKADNRDHIVVVLTGGPVADGDKKPPNRTLRYEIIGESFKTPIFPFIAGSKIEIKNTGHRTPLLYSPDSDGLIEETPLPDKGVRPIKKELTEPYSLTELRARNSAHLRGVLLPLPNAYFSLVDDSGKYEIKGVPAGKWKVKLFYRNGWIQMPDTEVTVTAGRPAKAPNIKLPAEINVEGIKNAEAN